MTDTGSKLSSASKTSELAFAIISLKSITYNTQHRENYIISLIG
jgi:hypothetical protein